MMDEKSSLSGMMRELSELAADVAETMSPQVEGVARLTLESLEGGGRLLFCGNGGSAADAQHLAAEYVVRFGRNRRALPALALTTDSSVLTAGGNDFGFDNIFARQVEAFAAKGDILFLHSTSGESKNLLLAAEAARARGVTTVAFLAKGGGRLAGRVDWAVVIPTDSTARAQELHMALGHAICQMVEEALFPMEEDAVAEGGKGG
jgi:D-sedoheptulose 7-phosphate isomerase